MGLTWLLALVAAGFLQQAEAASLDSLDPYVQQALERRQVPGAVVVVVKDDKVIFSKGYGVSRLGKPDKVDADTIFQMASVTKTFTAAGLGLQVDKKALAWDDEVITHLPAFALKEPYSTRYATSRDLLAHRTGLPAFGGDLLGKLGYSSEEILARVRLIEPATSFRNKALYSNVGFFVAGELLAKLTGSSWEEAIRTGFFVPLKMSRSGFSDNLDGTNVAAGHAKMSGKIVVIPWDRSGGLPPAGAITCTGTDMANWMVMHLNEGKFEGKQILQPETVREMHLPSMVAEVAFSELPPIDATSGYSFGLGWDNYHYHGKLIVEKAGALDGVRTVVTLIPDLKVGIAVFANLNLTVFPELVRGKFLEIYLGDSEKNLAEEINAKGDQLENLIDPPEALKNLLPLGHALNQYEGLYHNPLYGDFKVVKEEGKLAVKAGTAWKGELTPWSNDTFLLHWPLVNSGYTEATFTFGPEGNATELQVDGLGSFRVL